MKLQIEIEITPQMLCDQVITFIESSDSIWCSSFVSGTDFSYQVPDQYQTDTCKFTLKVEDPDGEEGEFALTKDLTHDDFYVGLVKMADKSPRHFNDLITGNGDYYTADAMMQYIVYGEIIFS